jgi:hypothetical protein
MSNQLDLSQVGIDKALSSVNDPDMSNKDLKALHVYLSSVLKAHPNRDNTNVKQLEKALEVVAHRRDVTPSFRNLIMNPAIQHVTSNALFLLLGFLGKEIYSKFVQIIQQLP